MKVLVTGSLGLVGSAAVRYYLNEAWEVHGVDNDMRKHFFGESASVMKNKIDHPNYYHYGVDISKIEGLIEKENFKLNEEVVVRLEKKMDISKVFGILKTKRTTENLIKEIREGYHE